MPDLPPEVNKFKISIAMAIYLVIGAVAITTVYWRFTLSEQHVKELKIEIDDVNSRHDRINTRMQGEIELLKREIIQLKLPNSDQGD